MKAERHGDKGRKYMLGIDRPPRSVDTNEGETNLRRAKMEFMPTFEPDVLIKDHSKKGNEAMHMDRLNSLAYDHSLIKDAGK